jgi:hypothetical protein
MTDHHKVRRLALNRETVRELTDQSLRDAAGGVVTLGARCVPPPMTPPIFYSQQLTCQPDSVNYC